MERTPTATGDVPLSACVITDCGQLNPDDPSLNESASVVGGDKYEDYPEDEDSLDINKPENALQVTLFFIRLC